MSRRRNDNPIDALMEFACTLPWWLSVGLTAATYLVLHWVASRPIGAALPSSPEEARHQASNALLTTLAIGGQYLVPMAFLVGAGVSAFRRAKP